MLCNAHIQALRNRAEAALMALMVEEAKDRGYNSEVADRLHKQWMQAALALSEATGETAH